MRTQHLSAFRPVLAVLLVVGATGGVTAQQAGPPAPNQNASDAQVAGELARAQDEYDVYLVQDRQEHRAILRLRDGRVVSAEFDGRRLSPADVRREGRTLTVYEAGAPVAAFRVPAGLLGSAAVRTGQDERPSWMEPPPREQPEHILASLGMEAETAAAEDLRFSTYRRGAQLRRVDENAAADLAGLRTGDIVVSVDGRPVRNADELRQHLRQQPLEGASRVTFVRNGREQWTTLRLGELPNRPLGVERPDDLGPEGDRRTDPERILGLSAEAVRGEALAEVPEYDRGLRIRSITRGGPAETAGLRAGDILVAVGRTAVATADDLRVALRDAPTGAPLRLRVVRGGSVFNVPVEANGTGLPTPPAREPADLERELGIQGAWADEESLGGARWESGVLVESVAGGSVAETMGLVRGDVIVALNDEPMPTPQQLSRRLAELDRNRPVRVTYVRSGQERIARFSMRP